MNKHLRAFRQEGGNHSRLSSKKLHAKNAARKPTRSTAAKSQQAFSRLNDTENESPKYGVDALDQLRDESTYIEARNKKKSKERGRDVDKRRRDTIATLYAIALLLKSDRTEWKKFCDKPYWDNAKKKPSPSKPDEALRHTVHYFHKSNGNKEAQKQASKHFKLLEPFFEQGSPRTDVRSALKNGVENLRRSAPKQAVISTKPCVQFRISERSFSKLKREKTFEISLKITKIFDRWAIAKILRNDGKATSK